MSRIPGSPPESGKPPFLAAAIDDWKSVLRTVALLIAVAIILGSLAWFILARLLPLIADQVEIKIEGEGHPVITLKDGRKVTVVSVPAYQLAVPTGITLDKNSEIAISADGLILTIGSALDPSTNLMAGLTNEVARKLLLSDLNRDSNPNWRLPNGKPYYAKDNTVVPEDPGRKGLKLLPEADYGCLLAFVVAPKTPYPDAVLDLMAERRGAQMFLKIGALNKIKFNHATGKFYLDNGSTNDYYFPDNGEIYLTINDTFIITTNEMGLTPTDHTNLTNALATKNTSAIAGLMEKENFLAAQREICDLALKKPYGIWYLDNRGSFTVTLDQHREGK